MGLFDFLKRDKAGATPARAIASGEQVEQARARARRRLIGAVVLLGVGVVAFPILFETQPRPIPVDIPIEIPSREATAPLAVPAPRVTAPKPAASTVAPVATSEAPREPAPPPPAVATKPETVAKPAETPKPPAAPAPREVIEPPKPIAAPVAAAEGRFVVQVGAFAEATAVRDARTKVEKLGLATYTQVIDTSNGKRTRVRVGPYATRDEADKTAAKLKAAGLPAAVLTL